MTDNKKFNLWMGLEHDAGAGESDYPCAVIFTTSKFVITAFGHDRDHCEDVLGCILRGRFGDEQRRYPDVVGDTEFIHTKANRRQGSLVVDEETDATGGARIYPCVKCGVMRSKAEGGTIFTVCDECWDEKHGRQGSLNCGHQCISRAESHCVWLSNGSKVRIRRDHASAWLEVVETPLVVAGESDGKEEM